MLDLFALRCCRFGSSMIFDGDVCPFQRPQPSKHRSNSLAKKVLFCIWIKVAAMEPLSPDLDRISVFMAISMHFDTFHNFMMPRCEVKAAPEVYKHPALKDSMTEI